MERLHQAAFGFSIDENKINDFIDYCKDNLPPYEKMYHAIDASSTNIVESIFEISKLENHYGPGFPEIILYQEIYLTPDEFQIIGEKKNTLKIEKSDITFIQFRFDREIPEKAGVLRIVGKPSINEYYGKITPQIIIEDWEWVPLEL